MGIQVGVPVYEVTESLLERLRRLLSGGTIAVSVFFDQLFFPFSVFCRERNLFSLFPLHFSSSLQLVVLF